jgi:hypothetical protein
MTTTNIPTPGIISPDMINFLGRAVAINGKPSGILPEQDQWEGHGDLIIRQHTPPVWAEPTIKAILALPWDRDNWADGATRTRPEAAANLLLVLVNTLKDDTPPPTSVVPTWCGGVQAEWHIGGFDLEIESEPDGTIEYNFAGPGVGEYEGPVDGNVEHIREYASLLSSRAE